MTKAKHDEAVPHDDPIDPAKGTDPAVIAEAVEEAKGKVFRTRTDFDIALNANTDPNIVLLDGATVKGGVLPVVAFRTRADGQIEAVPSDEVAAAGVAAA